MAELSNLHGVATSVVVAFLEKVWPFSGSDRASLDKLVSGSLLGFYPKNTVILRQEVQHPDHLFLIERGAVKLYKTRADGTSTLEDYRGEGCLFGVSAIVGASKAAFTVEAVEDTFCFLLDKAQFLEFVRNNQVFVENYFGCLSENLVCRTYSQMRAGSINEGTDEGLRLANACVGDAVKRRPQVIEAAETIHTAAQRMTEADVSVLLVNDPNNGIVGMLSDKDLRAKVVARRADYDQPVASIMTSRILAISAHSSCLDAVLQMMDSDVQHLVVTQGDDT